MTNEEHMSESVEALAEKVRLVGLTHEEQAALDALLARLAEAEAYAKEGWDWCEEALDALGVQTVFDIARAKAERDRCREALRRLIAAVDEYPGSYPDREEETAALQQARAALRPEQP
jgi:hypothetical protein